MQLRVLSASHLRRLVDMPTAIDAMRSAFVQLSSGEAHVPLRTAVETGAATTLYMPGFLPRPGVSGAKVVSVAPGNRGRGLPVVHAMVLLVDASTGRPQALLEGGWLTALRTGAASGLATDLLARPDASRLAVVGCGVQARTQIEAVRAMRPIEEVRLVSRTRASAEGLAAELRTRAENLEVVVCDAPGEAVRGAHVVVTATNSATPVLDDADVAPGTHLNAIGSFTPTMRELPPTLLARARVVVDQVEAARSEAGEVMDALARGLLAEGDLAELGAVAAGTAPGRTHADQVTVFKSVGSAAQDLAVAARALALADEAGVGEWVELG